ncbi:T9SS-dependent choice-of-anchor J family protein [Flavobacterium oreochromis]|uniref:T9SS-dependent choice-of-anchor J family protein n=1 Tax=Flavobacterium oreochromis TaxID=2906078 RepID=UPI001CE6E5E1|nr:choice-of-anchor J domain-containing protein [Flavobacterium oreochromis]QYS87142.1 T9SS type A sorting domain-containing protein [Flavobacterium oreochromis]
MMILFVFVFIQAKAQFNEGFENPRDFWGKWGIVGIGSDRPDWNIIKDGKFPKNGERCAMISGKSGQKGESYLITPQIEVKENVTDGFSYWIASLFDEIVPKRCVLKVSVKGKDIDDFEETLLVENLDKIQWKRSTIDLKKYIGKKIYLAFYMSDLGNGVIRIDDVENTSLLAILDSPTFNHEGFKFYPNPTKDYVNFAYTEQLQSISICNLQGQKMQTKEVNGLTETLEVLNYPQGVYIAKVIDTKGFEKTIKFVKN